MKDARFARWTAALLGLLAPAVAAGNICPPPPNPAGVCPLDINRSTLTELDADLDGFPDNRGSTGDFCTGGSVAQCSGDPAPEIAFDLVIADPLTQDVTCSVPGASVWIMSDGCNECLASGFDSATLPAGTTTDTTLKVVVSDDNGDVCYCIATLSCSFSIEAECDDGSDGDGDGLVDAADPDCCADLDEDGFCGAADCNDEDPGVHALPPVVDTLRVAQIDGVTWLDWSAAEGSTETDLVSGLVADLRGDDGFFRAGCLFDGETGLTTFDSRFGPEEGNAFYYLARSQNDCGSLGYGSSSDGIDAREALNAAGPCP